MRIKSTKTLHLIVVEFQNGMTRTVKVKAASREAAENKALRRHRTAVGIQRVGR